MLKQFLGIMMLLFLASCGTFYHDNSPAPIEHGLYTLEMSSCGQTDVGVLGCFYNPEKLEGSLSVPLWHKGEYQIKSDRCNYYANGRYEKNQTLNISYQDLLKSMAETDSECTYKVDVFVDGLDYGFRGQFTLIKDIYKKPQFTFMKRSFEGFAAMQIKEGSTVLESFSFKAETPGSLYIYGCGHNGEENDHDKISYTKNPQLPFTKILDGYLTNSMSCIASVILVPDDINLPGEFSMIAIQIFEKPVTSLPAPAISYSNGKLNVKFTPELAAIGVGNKFQIKRWLEREDNSITIDAKPEDEIFVRQASSNGRYSLYKVKNGEIIWNGLIKY